MFVNRKKELTVMGTYLDMIISGQKVNLSIFGQRRTGKTELLKRFKETTGDEVMVPYLNLERLIPVTERFMMHLIVEVIREALKEPDLDMKWTSLLLSSARIGEHTQRSLKGLIDIIDSGGPDLIMERGFNAIKAVHEDTKRPIVIILDEFQEIKNIHERSLQMIRSNTEKMDGIDLWVAGSVFSFFHDLFDSKNPFFGQFERMDLKKFDRTSTYELIDALLPFEVQNKQKNLIFRITGGQPYYITAICRRFHVMVDLMDSKDNDVLKDASIAEVFDKTGSINLHFEYLLDVSLSKFRNKGVHHSILYHLSMEEDTLTGISSDLGKPTGEVSNYLKSLVRTDLVTREKDIYRISDPLMGLWLSSRYKRDPDPMGLGTRKKIYDDLLERFNAVSTELGKAKEIELRERLSERFGREFKPYSSKDGSIEFDLVTEKGSPLMIGEIKWRTRQMDTGTMVRFIEKVKKSSFSDLDPKLIMISRGGFDRKAQKFARENGIICLNGDLDEV